MFSRDVSTAVGTECNRSCLLVDKRALEKEQDFGEGCASLDAHGHLYINNNQ